METLHFYYSLAISILFLIIGTFGNIISIVIFNNMKFNKHHVSRYLSCNCIISILIIIFMVPVIFPSILQFHETVCDLFTVVTPLLPNIHAWIAALCSFDRFISILFSNQFKFKSTLKFQMNIIFFITVLNFLVILPFIKNTNNKAALNETSNSNLNKCSSIEHLNNIYFDFDFYFMTILMPFLCIINSTIGIIYKMHRLGKKLASVSGYEIQIGKSLIVSDLLLIVFRMPVLVFWFVKSGEIFSFLFTLILTLSYTYYAFMFVLFLISNKIYLDLFLFHLRCKF